MSMVGEDPRHEQTPERSQSRNSATMNLSPDAIRSQADVLRAWIPVRYLHFFDALVNRAADAPVSETPAWISVKDRLPEIGQSVALVHIGRWEACGGDMERNVHDAGYLSNNGVDPYWSVRTERALNLSAYTHWMPLPEAPHG